MAGWTVLIATLLSLAGAEPASRPLFTGGSGRAAAPAIAAGLPDLTRLAQGAIPAVVGVIAEQASPPQAGGDAPRSPLDGLRDGPHRGIGSGFVIHRDGWVLTNAHVVEGAERVEVDLGEGGPRLAARVAGQDEEADIALLKVEARRPLPIIPLGDSDAVAVAEWVMVIGNPFGLDHSVSVGVVSQTGRWDVLPLERQGGGDFIQTDASINPGSSGAPVLNLRGEAIGIATAMSAAGRGIGFAIPINMAKEILDQLHDRGRVVRSWLGVRVKEVPPEQGGGVEVTEVAPGGPAAGAGLRIGDVILAVGGRPVRSPARLRWYVSTAGVGREVELRLRRGAASPERAIRVPLVEVPAREQARAEAVHLLGE